MLRKILSFFFALFVFLPHQYLNARWGIELPYNPALENPKVAANMEYLLTVVDIANEYLNGEKTTNYGTGEYATKLAADTIATNTAIDTLVRAPTFYITTTPDTTSFSITISAAGDFTIKCSDGAVATIRDKQVGPESYSHTFDTPGEHTIELSGRATGYSDSYGTASAAVSFSYTGDSNVQKISKISGSLGKIFPTLSDGSQPKFYQTFNYAKNLTEIPAELFDGIHGAPVADMFGYTFANSGLISIPDHLFAGISGAAANGMFTATFLNTHITSIPDGLFAGVRGTPAVGMFANTFQNTQITSIPANLFGELNGDGAPNMFQSTFSHCDQLQTVEGPLFSGTITPAEDMFKQTFYNSGLTSIPANLFGELNGDGAPSMFSSTFYGCDQLQTAEGSLFSGTITPGEYMFASTFANSGLTGVPSNLFAGVRGAPAVGMFASTFANSGLASIPADLFAIVHGAPAGSMFYGTFKNTQITSIPANLFGELNGDGATEMFYQTFYGCDQLQTVEGPLFSGTITPAESMFSGIFQDAQITSIPDNLFAGISGAPAARMFYGTFKNTPITSIPENLFVGVQGAPAQSMFANTFDNTQITSVPANLFGELNGDGAPSMFSETFQLCKQLQTVEGPLFSGTITPAERMFELTFNASGLTSVPADLFAGVQGAPAAYMFASTFYNTPITSIPENLFAGMSGPAAERMFFRTFYSCTSLTGPSARIDGQYLYEIWPDISGNMYTYSGATKLSDYDQIPDKWK